MFEFPDIYPTHSTFQDIYTTHSTFQDIYTTHSTFQEGVRLPLVSHCMLTAVCALDCKSWRQIWFDKDGHLTDYIPYFRTEGYVLVQDLLDADEEEMQAALAGAKMKRPQERRFKALIASAKDEAPWKNGA